MTNQIFEIAKKESERLKTELLASPLGEKFGLYLRNIQVMEIMKDCAEPSAQDQTSFQRILRPSNGTSEAARVRAAAKEYLSKENGRRTSGQIAKALILSGVEIGGEKPGSRVSAHLSADSATFDNSEGGYGLVEWASK